MDSNTASLLNQEAGSRFWVLGDLYTFKLTGKETNGALTVIDQIIQPESGPPPHIHYREDETFYVLEGRFSFLNGEKQTVLEAGSCVYIPKGTLHTFRNLDNRQGRLLVMITPSGLEEFFYAIGSPAAGLATPPGFDPAVIDKLMQLAETYQMEIVTPDKKAS